VTLAEARSALLGSHQSALSVFLRYLGQGLPAGLFRMRWLIIGTMVFFLAVAVGEYVHIESTPGAIDQVMAESDRQVVADEAFESYYTENPSASFFARVFTNNTWIALLSVGGGLTGVFTVMVQFQNATSLGAIAAVMNEQGALDVFFTRILPHGFLELTAIWVAGAAGLWIFWTFFVPGNRPRLRAIAEEGRTAVGVGIGAAIMLLVSGVLEGYLTGSSLLPWIAKDIIGGLVLAAFWYYVLVVGRRAVRRGETGDVDVDLREDFVPTAG